MKFENIKVSVDLIKRLIFYGVYIFIALVIQEIVFTGVHIGGVTPFILPACVVAFGFSEGGWRGSMYALLMGLLTDLTFPETVILYTVLFPAIAFVVGMVIYFYINKTFLSFCIVAAVMLAATALVQGIRVILLSGISAVLFRTVLSQVLISLPFVPLCYLPVARRMKNLD